MRHHLAFAVICAAASGCTQSVSDKGGTLPGDTFQFPAGTGQDAQPDASKPYPSDADWGYTKGLVVPNWSFIGYANLPNKDLKGVQQIELADFYNPHGYDYADCVKNGGSDASCAAKFPDAVFPAGSPWSGPKPRALSLGVAAVWCGPCNQEAYQTLPPKFAHYQPLGGHFVQILVDGPTPGTPATILDITHWKTKYKVDYSLMTDPSQQLEKLFSPLLPSNAIVRTSDMKILKTISGAPVEPAECQGDASCLADNGSYWSTFDKVLASPNE